MVQIYEGPRTWGSKLGSGLSQVLNQLAENKLQEVAQRNKAYGLEKSGLGLTSEQAQGLSMQDTAVLEKLIPELARAHREREFVQGLMPQQGQRGMEAQQFQPNKQQAMEQLLSSEQVDQQMSQPMTQQSLIQEGIAAGHPVPRNSKEAAELAKLVYQERREKQKLSSEERREAFKETKAERKEILQKAAAARDTLKDLERQEELETEGEGLSGPGWNEFLKRSGLDIPALLTPGSEEFNKISQNYLRTAKEYFGGRVTNNEVEQFLRTVPSLSQSPEGRKRIIANLKYLKRAELANAEALKEILKENKGIPPLDLMEQIDDRIGPKLEKLAKKFKEDLAREVPEGESSWKTAAGAIGGSLVGGAAKALSHAAPAAIGAAIGGPAGAAAGGLYSLFDYLKRNQAQPPIE